MLYFYKNLEGLGLLCIKIEGKRATQKRAKLVTSKLLATACEYSETFAAKMEELHKSGEYEGLYMNTVGMVQSYMGLYTSYEEHDAELVIEL